MSIEKGSTVYRARWGWLGSSEGPLLGVATVLAIRKDNQAKLDVREHDLAFGCRSLVPLPELSNSKAGALAILEGELNTRIASARAELARLEEQAAQVREAFRAETEKTP